MLLILDITEIQLEESKIEYERNADLDIDSSLVVLPKELQDESNQLNLKNVRWQL